jgi:hypothetical protein
LFLNSRSAAGNLQSIPQDEESLKAERRFEIDASSITSHMVQGGAYSMLLARDRRGLVPGDEVELFTADRVGRPRLG